MRVLLVALALLSSSCAISVQNDFDGVRFEPTASAAFIIDNHALFDVRGALIPVERPRAATGLALWLSSAFVPGDEAWRQLPAERLLDVRKDLATSDLLVLEGLNLDALQDTVQNRQRLSAVTSAQNAEAGIARGDGDFRFSVGQRAEGDDVGRGLGSIVTVEIVARELVRDGKIGGHINAEIKVRRERAANQPDSDLGTGTVTIDVNLPASPERVAEANLAVTAPIARCKAERGPDAGLACAGVAADPVTDENGTR